MMSKKPNGDRPHFALRAKRGLSPSSRPFSRSRGFALPAAVFLITALAAVAGVLVNLTATSDASSMLTLQSARAQNAAASGLAWAARVALANGTCGAASFTPAVDGLRGFTITTGCTASTVTEGSNTYVVYSLTSTATAGAAATGDRASRTLVARVTSAP